MIKPGDVVAYIPNHVLDLVESIYRANDGSILHLISSVNSAPFTFADHPDCEFGFVTSIKDGNAWCRFWKRNDSNDEPELRTTTCSERVSIMNLVRAFWTLQKDQTAIHAVCEKYGIEIGRENDD